MLKKSTTQTQLIKIMQTIQLTDREARISKIESSNGTTTVSLEWGGPDDRHISDFQLGKLGKACSGLGIAYGGNDRSGWAVLDGDCLLDEGDTIPVVPPYEA